MSHHNNEFQVFDYLYNGQITTEIVTDSQMYDKRVTTFLVRTPRFIIPQLNTHRVFSRNVSSCITGKSVIKFAHGDFTINQLIGYISIFGFDDTESITGGILCYDIESERYIESSLLDIIYNGPQPIFRLYLTTGEELRITGNHRIYTNIGWVTIEEMFELEDYPYVLTWNNKFSEIKSITNEKQLQHVYDLSVSHNDQAFVANDIIVHNSRAKRFTTTLKDANYTPQLWQLNHKGMQGNQFDYSVHSEFAKILWNAAKWFNVGIGSLLNWMGYSKQYTNRLIEPFSYVTYLVTASEWDNFLNLRDSYHAQFEIQVIARQIKHALKNNKPNVLNPGEWHIPFIVGDEHYWFIEDQLKVSVARCAKTSYDLQNLISSLSKDLNLHDRLVTDMHNSPFEHQVRCEPYSYLSGNLSIGAQYRKLIERDLNV